MVAPHATVSVPGCDDFHWWVRSGRCGVALVSWGSPEVLALLAAYTGAKGSRVSWG